MKSKLFYLFLSFLLGSLISIFLITILIKINPKAESIIYSPLGFKKNEVVGFLPYWQLTKTDIKKTGINKLVYFGLAIDEKGKIVKLLNEQEEEPGWTTFKSETLKNILEKAKQEKIKTSLLVHLTDEEKIFQLIENPKESADNLIADCTPLMKEGNFTDLNIDIESFVEATESSRLKYTEFIKDVKEGLESNNLGTLTVEITPISLVKPRLIDVSKIANIADYIVLMGYDYNYVYSYISGPVAPIGGYPQVRELDVESSVQQALNVMPRHKLILGIPLYGYEWDTLSDTPGTAVIPGSGKTASSRRVEDILKDCNNCKSGVDPYSLQPWLIIPENNYFRQIFYEDEKSLEIKLDMTTKYKIAGVAFWALGYEDTKILNPLKFY